MKILFYILLIIIGPQAWAQMALPTCWPAQIRGTGGDAVYRETATTEGVAWRCGSTPPYRYVRECRMKGHQLIHPAISGLTGIGAARAYWTANVRSHCREGQFIELDDILLEALQ